MVQPRPSIATSFSGASQEGIRLHSVATILDRLDVISPGEDTFPLAENVRAIGLPPLIEELGGQHGET